MDGVSPRSQHAPFPRPPAGTGECHGEAPRQSAAVSAVLAVLLSASAAYGTHVSTPSDGGDAGEVTYTPSTANFANPERGLYHHTGGCDKLSVLPEDRMVQLRTPKFKRTMYSPDPLPPTQAYDGSTRARLGHHNDCFLASPDDLGTYEDPAVEYPYLQDETRFLAMGGETCAQHPPRSDCPAR